MDAELEQFKTSINLVGYVEHLGYQLDRRRTTQSSAVLGHPDGHKVVVSRHPDGHWVYFTIGDDGRDAGTVLDFVMNRRQVNMGHARKELRDWSPPAADPTPVATPGADAGALAIPSKFDADKINSDFSAFAPLANSTYLQDQRKIHRAVLADGRFKGRIFEASDGDVIFDHHGREGLCGYERRGPSGPRFSAGGKRGLWFSQTFDKDTFIVITEAPIDALSYFQLYPNPAARFSATSGAASPFQWELLLSAIEKLRKARVIAAFDADEAGDQMAEKLQSKVRDGYFQRHRPTGGHKDWNEVLVAAAGADQENG